MMVLDFDKLCSSAEVEFDKMARFLGIPVTDDSQTRALSLVMKARSVKRDTAIDLSRFDPGDLAYVEELGYPLC